MNRGIALFVGLAALFAHTLAIYSDGSGALPPACDRAYAAFRVARNLVHEGVLSWSPSGGAYETYPSLLWSLWIALAERLRISPNLWSQWTGIVAALATVSLAARFHVERIASLMGPMMLVVSGGLAAAAACGTESALLALLLIASFLAYERGWTGRLAVLLTLACLTRPDALWFVLGLAAVRLCTSATRAAPSTPSPAAGDGPQETGMPPGWAAFAPPLLAVVASALARFSATGSPLSPLNASILAPEAGQWSEGLAYLRDFVVSATTPLGLVFTLVYLLRKKLSRTGRHALFLSALWSLGVLLSGGDTQPFYEALVPALPLVFHAAQEGLTVALDSGRGWVRRGAVAAFVLGLTFCGLASTFPVDRGPIPTEAAQLAWMRPTTRARPGFEEPLGRAGLAEEIRMTERARGIGLFMRDSLEPGATVLTAWPGAIGYLSRLTVLDGLGRVTPTPGERRCASWRRPTSVDVLAWLGTEPDYIVPTLYLLDRPPTREAIAELWLEELETGADDPQRRARIADALRTYEVVSIPLSLSAPGTGEPRSYPFYVLRRSELDLRPTLDVHVLGREVRVEAHNRTGHRQMANLRVQLELEDGSRLSLRPTGRFTETTTFARTGLLIYPTGGRSIALASFQLPVLPRAGGARPVRLRAVLVNPGSREEREFWNVSSETLVEL